MLKHYQVSKLQRFQWVQGILAALLIVLFGGCHWMHNYNRELERYPEMEDLEEEGLEESIYTEEELKDRQAQIVRINQAPYPPYYIDVGDVIALTVYNHDDLNTQLTVTPDGYIGIPFVGQIRVQGLTVPEATKAISDGLEPYLKNYAVGISPTATPSQLATIGGSISKPGVYPVRAGFRLGDLYALAGSGRVQMFNGQTLDMADFQNSLFIRKGKILPVDFERAIIHGDLLHNIEVQKSDYIYIASRTDAMVSVIGAVRRPSYLTWNPKMRLTDAITNTGGLLESYWRYAIIIRNSDTGCKFYRVNVDEVLAGLRRNPLVRTGDIIYVPMDALSYYNVFIRKLLPTGQLYNMSVSPIMLYKDLQDDN